MSGFLHRLSAQAMGRTTNTLRSASRTPYPPFAPVNSSEPGWQVTALDTAENEQQHVDRNGTAEDRMPGQQQRHINTRSEIGSHSRDNEKTCANQILKNRLRTLLQFWLRELKYVFRGITPPLSSKAIIHHHFCR